MDNGSIAKWSRFSCIVSDQVSSSLLLSCSLLVLQIRRGSRDNLGLIFHIFPQKHSFNPSLEASR